MSGILKTKRQTNSAVLIDVRQMACIVCCKRPVDAAHIKSRGAGGPDEMQNLLPLCRTHHQLQHAKGHVYMMEHFPPYKFYLQKLGWIIMDYGGRKTIRHNRYG